MQSFIYKSLKKDELYLFITHKDDFSAVPSSLLNSLGPLQYVMDLEVHENRKLAREDAGKVLEGLKTKGYFIQMPPITVPAPENVQ
ncbi:MAG: YcgL domain-containing protein [Gammaproteobacteria bacterium]